MSAQAAALYFGRKRKRIAQNPLQATITATFATDGSTVTREAGDFEADGFYVGQGVTIASAENAVNRGVFRLAEVTETTLAVAGVFADEGPTPGVVVAGILAG